MLTYTFYRNEDDGIELGWKPFPEGFCLCVKHKSGLVHVPLDLRALVQLQSEIQERIDELRDPIESKNFDW